MIIEPFRVYWRISMEHLPFFKDAPTLEEAKRIKAKREDEGFIVNIKERKEMELTIAELRKLEKDALEDAQRVTGDWLEGLYTGEAMGYRIVRVIKEKNL